MTNPTPEPIAERVRFWEEQDRINQELIPRVIRQHELLIEHIAEHDNLPTVVANAVQQAVAGVQEEQKQLYEAALESAKAEFKERTEEQKQLYESALETAKTELNRQTLETLQRESRRLRDLVIRIVAVSGIVIVAAAALASTVLG